MPQHIPEANEMTESAESCRKNDKAKHVGKNHECF